MSFNESPFLAGEKIIVKNESAPDSEGALALVKKINRFLIALIISNKDKDLFKAGLDDTVYLQQKGKDDLFKASVMQKEKFPLIIINVIEKDQPQYELEEENIQTKDEEESSISSLENNIAPDKADIWKDIKLASKPMIGLSSLGKATKPKDGQDDLLKIDLDKNKKDDPIKAIVKPATDPDTDVDDEPEESLKIITDLEEQIADKDNDLYPETEKEEDEEQLMDIEEESEEIVDFSVSENSEKDNTDLDLADSLVYKTADSIDSYAEKLEEDQSVTGVEDLNEEDENERKSLEEELSEKLGRSTVPTDLIEDSPLSLDDDLQDQELDEDGIEIDEDNEKEITLSSSHDIEQDEDDNIYTKNDYQDKENDTERDDIEQVDSRLAEDMDEDIVVEPEPEDSYVEAIIYNDADSKIEDVEKDFAEYIQDSEDESNYSDTPILEDAFLSKLRNYFVVSIYGAGDSSASPTLGLDPSVADTIESIKVRLSRLEQILLNPEHTPVKPSSLGTRALCIKLDTTSIQLVIPTVKDDFSKGDLVTVVVDYIWRERLYVHSQGHITDLVTTGYETVLKIKFDSIDRESINAIQSYLNGFTGWMSNIIS